MPAFSCSLRELIPFPSANECCTLVLSSCVTIVYNDSMGGSVKVHIAILKKVALEYVFDFLNMVVWY